MNTYWLGVALGVVLPLFPLSSAVLLLRRALRPNKPTHWFAFSASAMTFGFATLWLGTSVGNLLKLYTLQDTVLIAPWVYSNLTQAPYLAISMVCLCGGFWLYLLRVQRKGAP